MCQVQFKRVRTQQWFSPSPPPLKGITSISTMRDKDRAESEGVDATGFSREWSEQASQRKRPVSGSPVALWEKRNIDRLCH